MRIFLLSVCLMIVVAGLNLAIEPEDVVNGHVWLFDGGGTEDSSVNNLSGNIVGAPQTVTGINGDALEFNGIGDGVHIPDSAMINITSGPWSNRTVMAIFNCADVSIPDKQTIFEEGGRTRGIVIYVFNGELYGGAWNRDSTQIDWNGAWISTPIKSDRWYSVAVVIRDGTNKVEDEKFEMWLDGNVIGKEPGGQIYNHSNDNSIGYTKENTVFHDEGGSGDGWYFGGSIDEVWVVNEALEGDDLTLIQLGVEPAGKLTATWGTIKALP